MFNSRLLAIYLNDHWAGATGGLELAKRTAGANEGTEYGPPLERLAVNEGAAYGAAVLAGAQAKVEVHETIAPNPAWVEVYRDLHALFGAALGRFRGMGLTDFADEYRGAPALAEVGR